MWISQENENSQRKTDNQPSSQIQEKKAISLTFPKKARLSKKADFQRLRRFGRKFSGKAVFLNYRIEGGLSPRLGLTVSKKYGNAANRNYFKRIVRECFRRLSPHLPRGLEVNVAPLVNCSLMSFNWVLEDIESLSHAKSATKNSC